MLPGKQHLLHGKGSVEADVMPPLQTVEWWQHKERWSGNHHDSPSWQNKEQWSGNCYDSPWQHKEQRSGNGHVSPTYIHVYTILEFFIFTKDRKRTPTFSHNKVSLSMRADKEAPVQDKNAITTARQMGRQTDYTQKTDKCRGTTTERDWLCANVSTSHELHQEVVNFGLVTGDGRGVQAAVFVVLWQPSLSPLDDEGVRGNFAPSYDLQSGNQSQS